MGSCIFWGHLSFLFEASFCTMWEWSNRHSWSVGL